MNTQTPNPGSPEAVEQGCTCPVYDNAHGRGFGGDGEQWGWWITEKCPLHDQRASDAAKRGEESK